MWWIETTGYHFAGLIWLIVIAVIFVIALIALSTAGAAAGTARRASRMVQDHEAHHPTSVIDTDVATTPVSAAPAPITTAPANQPAVIDDSPAGVVESELPEPDPRFGDSMRILHERYARGEITREEYLQSREDMMAITR